jgi:hypothetical protein
MAAQVNSVLKNKKSKVTRKGKTTAKSSAPKAEFITVNPIKYGYTTIVNDALRASTMYGQPEPEDLEGQVKFWKDKYENSDKQCSKLEAQVGVLERIISGALNRSCNG